MARTTISQVIEDIRRELNSRHRYEVSTLGASTTALATASTITLTYALPPALIPGANLVVGTETMRVLEIDASAQEVEVIRGFDGSTVAAHSLGDEVQINPRFTTTDVWEALQDEVAGLPETLYRVAESQVAVQLGDDTIELPSTWTNLYGLIDARQKLTSPVTTIGFERTSWPRVEGRVVRGNATVWIDGPSTGIYFRPKQRVSNYAGTTTVGYIYFTAALPFDLSTFTTAQDMVTDFGMQASMLDLVKMGVKLRLMPDDELGRSDRRGQDENRRASEVPVGAGLSAWRVLERQYTRRRQEEANRLRALYPIVMT